MPGKGYTSVSIRMADVEKLIKVREKLLRETNQHTKIPLVALIGEAIDLLQGHYGVYVDEEPNCLEAKP